MNEPLAMIGKGLVTATIFLLASFGLSIILGLIYKAVFPRDEEGVASIGCKIEFLMFVIAFFIAAIGVVGYGILEVFSLFTTGKLP